MTHGAVLLGETHYEFDENGNHISQKFSSIAELIADFFPTLRLMWIPSSERQPTNSKPFAIGDFHQGEMVEPQIIMVLTEDELDQRLIERLFIMQRNAQGDPRALIQAQEDAMKAYNLKQRMAVMEEVVDRAAFLWRTPYHTINMGKDEHGRKQVLRT